MNYIMYTPTLMRVIVRHGLLPHLFADDTQVYDRRSLNGQDDFGDQFNSFHAILNRIRLNRRRQDRINVVCYSDVSFLYF